MKFSKERGGVKGISLVLCVAMMFNMAVPTAVFAQGTNECYSTESSLDSENACTDDPIDTKNGNSYFIEKRISVPCPGNGLDLELDLKYQSVADLPVGTLGEGWRHSYEWSLDVQYAQAVLYTGSGEKKVFEEAWGGTYLSPKASNWTLEETATGYEVGMPGGLTYEFGSNGCLSSIRDAWDNHVTCSFGTNDCLEAVAHANGRQIAFSNVWNAAISEWRVASIQVVGGESMAFAFNSDGQFTQIVEQVGSTSYTSSYQYADSYLTNKVNGAGFESSFEYETGGDGLLNGKGTYLAVDGYYEHEVEYVDSDTTDVRYSLRGTEQVFRYSRNGLLATKYGPGESVLEAMALGEEYSYAANDEDKTEETLFDNATGATWSEWMLHDNEHNVTNHSVSYCSAVPVHQLSTEYDPVWQLPSAFVDAEGSRTETIYTNGSPLVEKAFHSASSSYDTHYSYMTNGLPLTVTNANGHVTRFSHDNMGNWVSTAAELGPITTNTFDSLGFVVSTEILSESGASTGRITQYDNDAKGRVVQTTFADGLVSSNAFNALGYLVFSVDRAGRRTDHTYAPSKKLTSTTRYLSEGGTNTPVRIGYDLDKQVNVLSITEPRGRYVESYLLDIQDRVTAVTNIEGQFMTMEYSIGDFVSQIVRFDGSTITNTYDNAGQKETSTYRTAGGSPVATIAYSYWLDGETKTVSDGFSSITNSLDRLNHLTNQVVQVGNLQSEIDNVFDPVGNRTNSVVLVGSYSIETAHSFDAAERLTGIFTTGGTETQSFVYVYNATNGAVESVLNTNSGITCSYQYDLMDRVTNILYTASDGSLIRSLEYEYDAASMITKKRTEGGGRTTETDYVYDSLDRLVHESKTSSVGNSIFDIRYSHDLAGNRTSKTSNGWETTYLVTNGNRLASTTTAIPATNTLFVSGSANELIGTDECWGEIWITNLTTGAGGFPSVNGNSFFAELPATSGQTNTLHVAIPDRAGNMGYAVKDFWVPSAASGTPETKNYEYNNAGCLTNLNGVALDWDERYRLKNVDAASSRIAYEYDVLNRRASRTTIAGGITNVEYYVYNGNQVVADLDGTGNLLRTYVWGQGIDNLLCFTDHTTSNTYYAIKDHQNTVIALVDEIGSVVESYEYDAWGNILDVKDGSGNSIANQQSAIGNRYTFQGREIDWTTSLYYFRARWYNPETGRWLSKDPIGIEGGLNQYVAFGNNPVNFVDPFGNIVGIITAIIVFTPIDDIIVGVIVAAAAGAAVGMARGGKQNINDTDLQGKTDAEIEAELKDPSTSKAKKQKLIKQQKANGKRNKNKRRNNHELIPLVKPE